MLGLIGEAKGFLKGVVTKKTKTYDPSKNEVIVAEGLELDGMLSAELSEDTKTSTFLSTLAISSLIIFFCSSFFLRASFLLALAIKMSTSVVAIIYS